MRVSKFLMYSSVAIILMEIGLICRDIFQLGSFNYDKLPFLIIFSVVFAYYLDEYKEGR